MYAALPDLFDRYGQARVSQVADKARTGVIDQALLDRVAADVDAEIDAALFGRYATPLVPAPRLIRRLAGELMWELLHTASGKCPENVHEDANRARDLLARIAAGKLLLEADPVMPGPASSDARYAPRKPGLMQWP